MKKLAFIIALIIAAQMTKSAASILLPRSESWGIFTHAVQRGSILGAFIPMLLFFALLYYTVRMVNGKAGKWPVYLSFLLAGGISNALEIILWGYIVDWIRLGFMITNLADLYLYAAVIMFAVTIVRRR